MDRAKTNPAQTAWTSKAAHLIPIFFWTRVAVEGKVLSGVVVATIIKFISFLSIVEFAIAFRAAYEAKSEVVSCFDTKCRLFIPDLLYIHSSEVSTNFERSSFEYILLGRYEPTLVKSILL